MQESWKVANAWREVLARIFDGVSGRENVTPSWLVNPDTHRRLKLDQLYPEIGVAVRFQGLQGRQMRRPSQREEEMEAQREARRVELCQKAGVQLVKVDLLEEDPKATFKALRSALSAAASTLARSQESPERKAHLMEQIARCKKTCNQLARRIRDPEDLTVYAELWEDRTYAAPEAEPEGMKGSPLPQIEYQVGMSVWHASFGHGEVVAVEPMGDETYVSVRFGEEEVGKERRFAASLVQDKLLPR